MNLARYMVPETCNSAQRLGLTAEDALKKGMEEKNREFTEKGSER